MGANNRPVRMPQMSEVEAFDVVQYACSKSVGDLAFHQTNSIALEVIRRKLFPAPNQMPPQGSIGTPPGGVVKKVEDVPVPPTSETEEKKE